MNVLMAGLSDSVFLEGEKSGNTATRLGHYLEALRRIESESTLTDLVFTRRRVQSPPSRDGLWFIPVKAPRVQLFPSMGLLTAWRLRSRLHPDVITVQTPLEAGLLGLMLKRMFGAPLEVQVHYNLFSPYWLLEHRWWNRVRMVLARYVINHADAVRVVSSSLKRSLVEAWSIPEERIAVIPVPVFYDKEAGSEIGVPAETDQRQEPPTAGHEIFSDPHSKVVLFVGRLCYPKNISGLFTVIERVLQVRSGVKFLLIGDGPERPYAMERASRLGRQRVHVLGQIPYVDLPRYYRRADVLMLPSLYEGFGRVVLEGYLFGTPAVATRCGGPEDIIVDGETGFLTEVEDMEGFAERVLWLLDHPEAARQMGVQGQSYVQRMFKPERLIDLMVGQWLRLNGTGAGER